VATTAGEFAEAVAEEIPNFFRDTFDQLADGEGEYLRSGNPRSGTAKVGQAVGRAYCRLYGQNPDSVLGGVGPRVEKACRPYLDDLGYPQGPKVNTPFAGGQCPGNYIVTGTWTRGCGAQSGQTADWSTFTAIAGPIVGIVGTLGGNWTVQHGIGQSAPIFPSAGGGQLARGPGPGFACAQFPDESVVASSASITAVSPQGFSDTCGSPPPTITPPPPITDPQPPPFRFNPDGDIDIDIDVDINPDGSVTFDVGTGPITIDPFADSDGGGGGAGTDPPPGDVGSPGAPEDTGLGEGAEGEAPDGSVLVGLRLDVLVSPANAREFAPGIFRAACYVYMGTPSGLDHDPAGSMLQTGQFVFAEKENLTNWQVFSNTGFNIRVTPYYREVEG